MKQFFAALIIILCLAGLPGPAGAQASEDAAGPAPPGTWEVLWQEWTRLSEGNAGMMEKLGAAMSVMMGGDVWQQYQHHFEELSRDPRIQDLQKSFADLAASAPVFQKIITDAFADGGLTQSSCSRALRELVSLAETHFARTGSWNVMPDIMTLGNAPGERIVGSTRPAPSIGRAPSSLKSGLPDACRHFIDLYEIMLSGDPAAELQRRGWLNARGGLGEPPTLNAR